MKIHEYNEMMAHLTRRRPMSMGGSVLKPKRGLVDGPGSYSGEIRKTILANIDNIKSDYLKGASIRSLKEKYFPDEDLDSVRTTLNRELDKVVSNPIIYFFFNSSISAFSSFIADISTAVNLSYFTAL